MKSVLEYLSDQKDMAWHNRLCYSTTYGMDTPKDGQETQFAESIRDCEIIDELIDLVKSTIKTEPAQDELNQMPVLTYAATAEEMKFVQQLERQKNLHLSPEEENERREYARAALNFNPSEGQRKLFKKLNISKVALAKGEAPNVNAVTQQPCKVAHQNPKVKLELENVIFKTEKERICITQHLKAYFEQCRDNKPADWGEPCVTCSHNKACDFKQIDGILSQLSQKTEIPISRCFHMNAYEANTQEQELAYEKTKEWYRQREKERIESLRNRLSQYPST